MKTSAKFLIGAMALGAMLTAAGGAESAPPHDVPPGHQPTEITGTVQVSNFPENQDVTVTNVVDVNIVAPERVQVRIVGGASADAGPVLGVIQRADGAGSYITVPSGTKLVLTDFIVAVGVPTDPVIGDSDYFLGNINRAAVGSDCAGSQRRLQFRVFRRDQVVASLTTGIEYFPGEQVCLATGAPGDNPRNVDLSYQIGGYLVAQ